MHAASHRVFSVRAKPAFNYRATQPLIRRLPSFTFTLINSLQYLVAALVNLERPMEITGALKSLVVLDNLIIIHLCRQYDHV